MNFECLLLNAKAGNEDAITAILQMYRPLLLKYAIIDGVLDEDLYQELSIILLKAIKLFKIYGKSQKILNFLCFCGYYNRQMSAKYYNGQILKNIFLHNYIAG